MSAELQADARAVSESIAAALVGHSHQAALVALLTTYQALAELHPCCLQGAGQAALQVGGALLLHPGAGRPGALH